MDAFYASVEQRDAPELRGRPVIVAWSPGARSVVVAASYEARTFGVHSAMPAARAMRLCPSAVVVRPDFDRYRQISRQIRAIFLRHTPLVEPLSLDEAYLDVTDELTGLPTATATAVAIRREIMEETSLTASAGVAPNKFLAKIASDWKKPDGLFVIKPGQIDQFLIPLPVGKLPGVGPATGKALHEIGIETVGDLRALDASALTARFGRFGERLWELARGIDERPVTPEREPKSISNEVTFERDLTRDEVRAELAKCAEKLWEVVAKKQLHGRTVTVKLRSSDFVTATRRETPPLPPSSQGELLALATRLLDRFDFGEKARFRLVGVGLSSFFDEDDEQQRKLFSV